jgi:hypothetical protein
VKGKGPMLSASSATLGPTHGENSSSVVLRTTLASLRDYSCTPYENCSRADLGAPLSLVSEYSLAICRRDASSAFETAVALFQKQLLITRWNYDEQISCNQRIAKAVPRETASVRSSSMIAEPCFLMRFRGKSCAASIPAERGTYPFILHCTEP